jgi:hypothetical protein
MAVSFPICVSIEKFVIVVLLDCLTFTAQLYDNDERIMRETSCVFSGVTATNQNALKGKGYLL